MLFRSVPEEPVRANQDRVPAFGELWLNLRPAGLSDELIDTVNYAEMYQLIKEIIENQCFNLLEALAENIAAVLLKTYKPEKVVITVAKPQPPLLGKFDYFSVTIERW